MGSDFRFPDPCMPNPARDGNTRNWGVCDQAKSLRRARGKDKTFSPRSAVTEILTLNLSKTFHRRNSLLLRDAVQAISVSLYDNDRYRHSTYWQRY
eukprot:683142-Rhodomonas_salina.33